MAGGPRAMAETGRGVGADGWDHNSKDKVPKILSE